MASEDYDNTDPSIRRSGADGSPVPFDHEPVLDQNVLDALLAAQSGERSPLLDQNPIDGNELLLDDTSLSPGHEEDLLVPVSNDLGDSETSERATVSKDDIDRLIAEHLTSMNAAPPAAAPFPLPPQEEAPLSQAELDRMMARLDISPEPSAPVQTPAPLQPDAPMEQAELDRLFAASSSEAERPEPKPESSWSRSELDRILEDQGENLDSVVPLPPAAAPQADTPMTQAELDRLLALPPKETVPAALQQEAELSQADLDQLLLSATQPAPAAPEPMMTQEELDRLLSGATSKPATPPAPPAPEPMMTQEELDRLLSGATSKPAASPAPPAPEPMMTQEELDRLLSGEASKPATPPAPPAPEPMMRQEELDRLLSGATSKPAAPPPPPAPEPMMTQEELDRLLSGATSKPATPPAPPAPEPMMTQEELDRLLSGATSKPAAPPPPPAPEPMMTQEELDRLLSGEASKPAAPPEDADKALSQAELDRLLNSMAAQPKHEQEPAPAPEPIPLAQTELDQLLSNQLSNDAPLDQAALDALLAGLETDASVGGSVSQADIDALLASSGMDQPVASVPPPQDDAKPVTLSQSDLDALLGTSTPAPVLAAEPAPPNAVSQDMIDALIAAAGIEEAPQVSPESLTTIGSENLAAAATSPASAPGLLKQETIYAPPQKEVAKAAKAPEVEQAKPKPKPQPVAKAPRSRSFRLNAARLLTALAAGVLVGFGTFTTLYLNQERTPSSESLKAPDKPSLAELMQRARTWMEARDYPKAIALLDGAIKEATEGPERADARFLRLEAQYRGFQYSPGSTELAELHGAIDDMVKDVPNHPRTPEALRWKAELYEQDQLPYAAQDIYKQIIERYPTAPGLDQTLLDAARIANALRNPREAADYAQRLLNEFPGSPCGPQAHLFLGDAYAMAGMQDDARTLYVRLADSEPNTQRGAEAYLRLGHLAMEQKEYDAAIRHLETCLKMSSSKEGNDAVYLLLAQAYRAKSRFTDAEKTLNDLINFFPEAKTIPEALVELSQVTEAMGNRKEAVRLAQQAANRFPTNPLALKNHGIFQGLEGNAYGAATALVAADEAGANDPAILLTAARHYRTLAMDEEARRTYARLRSQYAKAPEALTAGIEEAQTMYALGKAEQALQQLEDLAKINPNPAQRLPVSIAMAHIYRDLGLSEAAAEVSKEIAAASEDPQTLAESAVDLLSAGALEDAQKVLGRINLAQVNNPTAYALLTGLGQSLLKVDPQRGLERMEEAYLNYPDARNPDDEQRLLQAYLAANRPAAARRLIMEKAADARNAPSKAPHLIVAAATWGDYLYAKGDYRAAADAYATAIDAAGKSTMADGKAKTSLDWSKYQRANALLELADFQSSLALYKEVASSGSPWAKEAGLKASYAQLEQKLRGASPVESKKEG